MGFALEWMPPQAPYMPIATVGLLDLLAADGHEATAVWRPKGRRTVLYFDAPLDTDGVAALLSATKRPSLAEIDWPDGRYRQGLKPTLKSTGHGATSFRFMTRGAPAQEARLLRAIVTEAVLDSDGVPGRSRLLRGVKADLSSVEAAVRQVDPESLAIELCRGPRFIGRDSGWGLGLVPEVQTFGGTTGPLASDVGAYSPLLFLLLWRGIIALPPVGVTRGRQRVVGGALVTRPDVLSWPRWRIPVGLPALRSLFAWDTIHEDSPDLDQLTARGVDAVYRTQAVPLSTTGAVFRWGELVAG